LRETARERGRWRERVRKRKREFTAVYPYRSSLAALASPRQGWAESKTANSQQVQPAHAPTRSEPDVSRPQKMQCIITEPTSVRSEDIAVSVAQNSKCFGLGIPRWHCVQGAAGTGVCCSKHTRERDCQLSRACRQATTALADAVCTFAGTQYQEHSPADTWKGPVRGLPMCNCRLPSPPRRIQAACLLHEDTQAQQDPAEVSRAATHRSVLLHQSGWV